MEFFNPDNKMCESSSPRGSLCRTQNPLALARIHLSNWNTRSLVRNIPGETTKTAKPIPTDFRAVNMVGSRYYVDLDRTESGDGLTPATAKKSLQDMFDDTDLFRLCNLQKQVVHVYVTGTLRSAVHMARKGGVWDSRDYKGCLVIHDLVAVFTDDDGTPWDDPEVGMDGYGNFELFKGFTGVVFVSADISIRTPKGIDGVTGVNSNSAERFAYWNVKGSIKAVRTSFVANGYQVYFYNSTFNIHISRGGNGANGVNTSKENPDSSLVNGGGGGAPLQVWFPGNQVVLDRCKVELTSEGSGDGGNGGNGAIWEDENDPTDYRTSACGAGGGTGGWADDAIQIIAHRIHRSEILININETANGGKGGSVPRVLVVDPAHGGEAEYMWTRGGVGEPGGGAGVRYKGNVLQCTHFSESSYTVTMNASGSGGLGGKAEDHLWYSGGSQEDGRGPNTERRDRAGAGQLNAEWEPSASIRYLRDSTIVYNTIITGSGGGLSLSARAFMSGLYATNSTVTVNYDASGARFADDGVFVHRVAPGRWGELNFGLEVGGSGIGGYGGAHGGSDGCTLNINMKLPSRGWSAPTTPGRWVWSRPDWPGSEWGKTEEYGSGGNVSADLIIYTSDHPSAYNLGGPKCVVNLSVTPSRLQAGYPGGSGSGSVGERGGPLVPVDGADNLEGGWNSGRGGRASGGWYSTTLGISVPPGRPGIGGDGTPGEAPPDTGYPIRIDDWSPEAYLYTFNLL